MLKTFTAQDLSSKQQSFIFDTFKENMYRLYTAAGWDWDESSKRRELFNPNTNYLIYQIQGQSVGYVVMEICKEECREGMVQVLYCLEFQIRQGFQRRGIGLALHSEMVKFAFSKQQNKEELWTS